MKILELRAENVKNLKVVEIKADSTANILTGENGAGKSAVLDSIFMILTGKKIEQPIRNGEKRAEISVDLGQYKVKRVYTEKGDRLEVMSADGATFKSPQTLLDNLLGKLSFDPLEFAKMKPGPQRELLAEIVSLDLKKFDEEKQKKYDERTLKNREVTNLQAVYNSLPEPAGIYPDEEVSVAAKFTNLEELEKKRSLHAEYLSERDGLEEESKHVGEDIAELRQEIKEIEAKIERKLKDQADISAEIKRLDELAPENVTNETIDALRNDIKETERVNGCVRKQNERRMMAKKLETAQQGVASLTAEIEKIDQQKKEKITSASFPLPGLSINDEVVLYENKPFSQLSTGEQIRISTAIAMKLNPTLKIILIREGSLLDKKGLQEIIAIAKDNDYQLWIEKIGDDKKVGIFIENGEIVK